MVTDTDKEKLLAGYIGKRSEYQEMWFMEKISKAIKNHLNWYCWYNLKFSKDMDWMTEVLNKIVEEGNLVTFNNNGETYCVITAFKDKQIAETFRHDGKDLPYVCFLTAVDYVNWKGGQDDNI